MKEKILPTASPKGLIVFCDRNQRYEGGLKAWLFLGPIILGAWILEVIITSDRERSAGSVLPWLLFLLYLLVFPSVWKKALSFISRRFAGHSSHHASVQAPSVSMDTVPLSPAAGNEGGK